MQEGVVAVLLSATACALTDGICTCGEVLARTAALHSGGVFTCTHPACSIHCRLSDSVETGVPDRLSSLWFMLAVLW